MIITEKVEFLMPQDPELQVAAVSVYQTFVNTFQERAKANDVAGVNCSRCKRQRTAPGKCAHCGDTNVEPIARYLLSIRNNMPVEIWRRFYSVGLHLNPVGALGADEPAELLADLSDASMLRGMKHGGKHAVQIGSLRAGIAAPALPTLRQVEPRKLANDYVWGALVSPYLNLPVVSLEGLAIATADQYTGFVGKASMETYVASAMGFPVVELVPVGRPRSWLSKFQNLGYRVVLDDENAPYAIDTAMRSVEAGVMRLASGGTL